MDKRTHSRWLGCTLALLCGIALFVAQLNAQQPEQPSPSQTTAQQAQPSTAQPQAQPEPSGQQAPASQAQSPSGKSQVFAGTVVKTGDKYVLQDDAGKAYDIDRQDLAKAHEGKKVTIQGTLDPDGKTIHVQ
jgi:cell division septation protein DedD